MNIVNIELLSDPEETFCPSVLLAITPADILDLKIIGIYPINEQLNESLDQFLNRASTFIEDTIIPNSLYLEKR